MALHPHQRDLRGPGERLRGPVEELQRPRIHDVVIHPEPERCTQHHLGAGQGHIDTCQRLGAAVSLRARKRARRDVRAAVEEVCEAIPVVVEIGAAVAVGEAVEVLLFVRTLVHPVEEAIAVVVVLRHTIAILEAVAVFGNAGGPVDQIGHLVGIVVEVGTAVLVDVAVKILRLVGAEVGLVRQAIAIAIAIGGRGIVQAQEVAEGRPADSVAQTNAHAGRDSPSVAGAGGEAHPKLLRQLHCVAIRRRQAPLPLRHKLQLGGDGIPARQPEEALVSHAEIGELSARPESIACLHRDAAGRIARLE